MKEPVNGFPVVEYICPKCSHVGDRDFDENLKFPLEVTCMWCDHEFIMKGIHGDLKHVPLVKSLLEALQASTHTEHTLPDGKECSCSNCVFVRLRDEALNKL